MEAGRTDLVDRPWVLGQFMRRELDSVENSLVLRTVGISGREKAGRQSEESGKYVNAVNKFFL